MNRKLSMYLRNDAGELNMCANDNEASGPDME